MGRRLGRALAAALVFASLAAPARAQNAQGSIAVSLTIVQPATIVPVEFSSLSLTPNGRFSMISSSPVHAPTSQIVMVQLSQNGYSGMAPTRYEPSTRSAGGYITTARGVVMPRVASDTVQVNIRQLVVAGT